MDTEAVEAQETVLSGHPVKVGWDGDAKKSIIFDKNSCLLAATVLEKSAEQREDQTGYIDCCRCNEVVPIQQSVLFRDI